MKPTPTGSRRSTSTLLAGEIKLAHLCSPRTAALGIAGIVLLVGAFENPEHEHVYRVIDAPHRATRSDSKPIRNSRSCERIMNLPANSVQAVYNRSAWAPEG